MARGVVVHSVTGEAVELSGAADEKLAAMLSDLDDEKSRLREIEGLVSRELAKRAGSKRRMVAGDFQLDLRTYVNVSRRLDNTTAAGVARKRA